MSTQTAIEQQANRTTEIATQRKAPRTTYQPSVDILENQDELTVLADLPGLRAEDIDIHFENGVLTLKGEVADRQANDARFLIREYGVGNFLRQFRIGEVVDAEKISADYANGVLTLHLPKVVAVKPRKITVNVA